MQWIYNNYLILENENIFYIFITLMLVIMIVTGILVYKELKNIDENK